MSTPEEPLDVSAVAADEAALEQLRTARADGGDAALVLLRELLLDVERDLPAAAPVGRGSTVVTLAAEEPADRRLARGGAVVVALAAGVLSLGGVAAAGSLAPPDSPLHGLGEAVRSAAGAVVGAVTPPDPRERGPVALPTSSPSPTSASGGAAASTRPAPAPRTSPPGAAVSTAARSQAAARQVAQLLDAAEALLADGRTAAAVARLDLAERKLAEVLPADRGELPRRLADLRARAQAVPGATGTPSAAPSAQPGGKPEKSAKPDRSPRPERTEQPGTSRSPGTRGKPTEKPALTGQLSDRDASVKPRA